MKENFWQQNPKEVAKGLLGKIVIVGKTKAVILKAQGFPRQTNTGIYEPVAQMNAGKVYCPRVRNSIILLIATYDGGQIGGCVLIRTVEAEGQIYDGLGKVSKRLGIVEPRIKGKTQWIDEDTFVIKFDDQPEPVIKPQKTKKLKETGIGKKTLERLMPKIVEKFLKEKPQKTFVDFVNDLLENHPDETSLRKALR